MIVGTEQRSQNVRVGLMVAAAMVGLFVFSVVYISLFH